MRTLGPYVFRRRGSVIWVDQRGTVHPKSLPGLGFVLSGGAEAEGGRRGGGGPLIWTVSSLSYLTSGVVPTLKVEERQCPPPQIEGRKVTASH